MVTGRRPACPLKSKAFPHWASGSGSILVQLRSLCLFQCFSCAVLSQVRVGVGRAPTKKETTHIWQISGSSTSSLQVPGLLLVSMFCLCYSVPNMGPRFWILGTMKGCRYVPPKNVPCHTGQLVQLIVLIVLWNQCQPCQHEKMMHFHKKKKKTLSRFVSVWCEKTFVGGSKLVNLKTKIIPPPYDCICVLCATKMKTWVFSVLCCEQQKSSVILDTRNFPGICLVVNTRSENCPCLNSRRSDFYNIITVETSQSLRIEIDYLVGEKAIKGAFSFCREWNTTLTG